MSVKDILKGTISKNISAMIGRSFHHNLAGTWLVFVCTWSVPWEEVMCTLCVPEHTRYRQGIDKVHTRYTQGIHKVPLWYCSFNIRTRVNPGNCKYLWLVGNKRTGILRWTRSVSQFLLIITDDQPFGGAITTSKPYEVSLIRCRMKNENTRQMQG